MKESSETTFYLNEGIKFHNGEDLTAEDVAYTFNWVIDPANASPNLSEYEFLQEVVVIDEYTVKFINKPDWTPYCPGLVSESAAIVPKDTCEEMGPEAFNLAPIGSGPYKFVEWIASPWRETKTTGSFTRISTRLSTARFPRLPR
jgi:peptide/nickel transport system substrate-binding protein